MMMHNAIMMHNAVGHTSLLRHQCRHTHMLGTIKPQHRRPFTPRHGYRSRIEIRSMAIKKTSEKNVVCVKTLVAHPQHIDKVQRLCQELLNSVQPCRADRLSQSGLLAFECSNDRWDSNVFHFWERYESNVAMGRFNNRDDMQRFMSNVQEYLEKPVGMVLYEWRDGHMGAACIQGGPKGEGGLDDATGAGGRGGAGYTQTSKAVDLGAARANADDHDESNWIVQQLSKTFKLPWVSK